MIYLTIGKIVIEYEYDLSKMVELRSRVGNHSLHSLHSLHSHMSHIIIKTASQIQAFRESGAYLTEILTILRDAAKP
jgi:hypothetical protein